jgi:hypothetical protein
MERKVKYYCPYCKNEVAPDAKECASCGVVYGPDTDTLEAVEIDFDEEDEGVDL